MFELANTAFELANTAFELANTSFSILSSPGTLRFIVTEQQFRDYDGSTALLFDADEPQLDHLLDGIVSGGPRHAGDCGRQDNFAAAVLLLESLAESAERTKSTLNGFRLAGLPFFSGSSRYSTSIHLPCDHTRDGLPLDVLLMRRPLAAWRRRPAACP